MSLNFTNKIFNIGGEGTPTLQFYMGGFIIGGKKDAPLQGSWQVPAQTNLDLSSTNMAHMITAFGNNKYVAISEIGYTTTSTDGIAWSNPIQNAELYNDGNSKWASMTYGNNKFVAAGFDGQGQLPTIYISTSTDGITWTTANMINPIFAAIDIVLLTYTGQQFVILGGLVDMATMAVNWAISTSTDGITWTTPNVTNLSFDFTNPLIWRGLVYGNGKFVILGANSNDGNIYISTSTDGVTWTTPQVILSGGFRLVLMLYNNGNFIALLDKYQDTNFYSITSTDGLTWSNPNIETNLGDTTTYTNRIFQTFNNANFVYSMLGSNDNYWYITTYQN